MKYAVVDFAEFDDLEQEGLIAVWNILRYGYPVSAQAIEHRMIDWCRIQRRHGQTETLFDSYTEDDVELFMSGPTPRIPNSDTYDVEEVEALVEGYTELESVRYKLPWLIRLCDIDIAVRKLSAKQRASIVLVGKYGFDIRTAGRLLNVSHVAAWKRYRRGLQSIVNILNGGTS